MDERVVYLNGQFVPESQAKVSVFDRGFQWGDAVYDTARSYGHKPFQVREHVERLYRSLRYTRMQVPLSIDEMVAVTLETFERNKHLLGPNDDYYIWHTVSRGLNPPSRSALDCRQPTIVICNWPVYFEGVAKFYKIGAHVVTPSIRRTPPMCLEPRAKVANKMNHILADYEAKLVDPEAYPLLLDVAGNIAESSGANFFLVSQGRLCTSSARHVLAGITRDTVMRLARDLGMPVVEGDFTVYDVVTGDEAFLTTTPHGIIPVSRINGHVIGTGTVPGPITDRLIKAFSDLVGVDIVAQALSHLPAEGQPHPMPANA
jgi:branched-chain amino acid aminotransferase